MLTVFNINIRHLPLKISFRNACIYIPVQKHIWFSKTLPLMWITIRQIKKIMIGINFNNSQIELFAIKKYFNENVVKYHHENLSEMRSRSSGRWKNLSKMQKQGHQGRKVLQNIRYKIITSIGKYYIWKLKNGWYSFALTNTSQSIKN